MSQHEGHTIPPYLEHTTYPEEGIVRLLLMQEVLGVRVRNLGALCLNVRQTISDDSLLLAWTLML